MGVQNQMRILIIAQMTIKNVQNKRCYRFVNRQKTCKIQQINGEIAHKLESES